jgi:hypothetical protein
MDENERRLEGLRAQTNGKPAEVVRLMTTPAEHPELRWVSPAKHLDGSPWPGYEPGRRHLEDCPHIRWEDSPRPIPATNEQMREVRPCLNCIAREFGKDVETSKQTRFGDLCPACYTTLPLTGKCDNCELLAAVVDTHEED